MRSRRAYAPGAFITERRERNDITDASDAAEQIDSTEAADPIDPIESTEPTEPIDSTEPREPMHSSESSDHSDHFELFERALTARHRSAGSRPMIARRSPLCHQRRRWNARVAVHLRDRHRDLVHEAPAPFLARLQRADDRVT
jgi:hypothetical protein